MLLGAGVCVLGPIEIGPGSKVGAGSVVVTDLPCHCVAVGVPARIIRQSCVEEPCVNMDLVSHPTAHSLKEASSDALPWEQEWNPVTDLES